MAQIPHQHIPIIKVTVLSDDITEEMVFTDCSQYGTVARIKKIEKQNSYYVVFENADESKKAFNALKENQVPHDFIEFPHSGHGLQNDNKQYKLYMDKLNEYLEKYLTN